ncbi:hypothetical protein C8J56DRAFT_924920 [Mycena floridula]|nr:hypothetical protein C8J56DRAFT_924920 [Mycena floridula]
MAPTCTAAITSLAIHLVGSGTLHYCDSMSIGIAVAMVNLKNIESSREADEDFGGDPDESRTFPEEVLEVTLRRTAQTATDWRESIIDRV